jgi:NAD(P)-dependent dehydrogenase (short-subunit alcohol dehydrogenase family)
MKISGANAIVVGGASGMARATAEMLVREGARVAILDRPTSQGEQVAAAIGGGTRFHPCDVVDFAATEAAIRRAADDLGSVQFGLNTAGGGIAMRTLTKEGPHSLDAFRAVIDLNLVASFNIARVQAELMSRNEPYANGERGVIVMTASIAAFEGQIGQVAYSAAKSGIAGMTLTMARDLGSLGIRVMTVAPSLFETGLTRGIPQAMADTLTRDAAFPKRMGRPEEYALLARSIFENPMMNGSTIRLDGGQRFAPKCSRARPSGGWSRRGGSRLPCFEVVRWPSASRSGSPAPRS